MPARVDIVLPVLNEERVLERSVRTLHHRLCRMEHVDARIIVVDNGSTDETYAVARRLASTVDRLTALRFDERGRGRALRRSWLSSDADIVAYMDVDLSTDLRALEPLLEPLISGRAHIAVGSRLSPESQVSRSLRRELISRVYNRLLHASVGMPVRDAQCGFKAVRADVARGLLPLVEDEHWFFDTELLVRADRAGCRIVEVPVRWVEDPDSRVEIVHTALEDLRGIQRLRRDGVQRRERAVTAQFVTVATALRFIVLRALILAAHPLHVVPRARGRRHAT